MLSYVAGSFARTQNLRMLLIKIKNELGKQFLSEISLFYNEGRFLLYLFLELNLLFETKILHSIRVNYSNNRIQRIRILIRIFVATLVLNPSIRCICILLNWIYCAFFVHLQRKRNSYCDLLLQMQVTWPRN